MSKEVTIINNTRQLLKGILFGDNLDAKTSPALIVCHGFTGTKEGGNKAIAMAEYFSSYKIATLLFDFSGNGESEGNFEDITLTGQVGDLSCVVNYIKDLGFKNVFIMGRSFGGTTAICYQGKYKTKDVCGVICVNSVAKPYELFSKFIYKVKQHKVILMADDKKVTVKQQFFDDLKNWDILSMAKNIAPTPILIIQGDKDEVVDPNEANLLYNHAYYPKELKIIKDGDHTLSNNYKTMWDISLNFILRYSKDV